MVENILKKIDKQIDKNNQVEIGEIKKALDDGFFDKAGKEHRINDLVTQLEEEKKTELMKTYTDSLTSAVKNIFENLAKNNSVPNPTEEKLLQLYDITLLKKDHTGVIQPSMPSEYTQDLKQRYINTLTNQDRFTFFQQELINEKIYAPDTEKITYENSALLYKRLSTGISAPIVEGALTKAVVQSFIETSRLADKQAKVQELVSTLPKADGRTVTLEATNNTMTITFTEEGVMLSEVIDLTTVLDDLLTQEKFATYITSTYNVLDKRHQKINAIDINGNGTIDEQDILIAIKEFSPEDWLDVKAGMGKKKNEALAKSLTTALTELHDKIIPTYIAKPDKVDANWIAVLNLYLVLIKGQNIKVDKEQSPTLLSHLDTEKANRVLKHTENKTEDYTKNLKDFGLKTLKKFPTLSGCGLISKENIKDYFDLPSQYDNDADKALIANNLQTLIVEYYKVDPSATATENISLTVLDKKKKAKEAEYQENRAIVDIYNKLSQPEFESGKLNLGALAGKETAEGVACITKALVQFISDKYEGNIEGFMKNRSTTDGVMSFIIRHQGNDIKGSPLQQLFDMYSTAILQPFHDKKNPAMRDDMVMKLYEANKYSRDELKDPTDSEINKFYTNAADAKYFKAHINDIKKIFGERRKTEQYVATTKSILMRRKCMFPDVDNATTREFLALRDSKVSAAQNTINFYQKRIANQEGEKSVADREWQKARSELTYATKDTGHMSPSEYKAYTNNINSLKAKQIEAYQKSAKIGSEIGRIKKEVNIFVKEDMSKMMDELNQEYVNTIIKLNNYNIGQIQKIGKIASPFGSNVQLDFGKYTGINGGTSAVIVDTWREKMRSVGEDKLKQIQEDPIGFAIDVIAVLVAITVTGAVVGASYGSGAVVAGGVFFMTQNAVKMIGHGTYEAIKGEENNENINPFVYGMLKGADAIDESGKMRPAVEVAMQKGVELAVTVAMFGVFSAFSGVASSTATGEIGSAASKEGAKSMLRVFGGKTAGSYFGEVGGFVAFNDFLASPFQAGAMTIARGGTMDNALQSFSDQIANAVKPENLLASIITNMAFIGGLKLYSNVLMSPLVGRIINARANTKVENGIKESIKKSEQINIELKRLEVEEGCTVRITQGKEGNQTLEILKGGEKASPEVLKRLSAIQEELLKINMQISEGYTTMLKSARNEIMAGTKKGKLLKLIDDYKLMSPYKSPEKILQERIDVLKNKKDPESKKVLEELLKVQEQFLRDRAAIEAEILGETKTGDQDAGDDIVLVTEVKNDAGKDNNLTIPKENNQKLQTELEQKVKELQEKKHALESTRSAVIANKPRETSEVSVTDIESIITKGNKVSIDGQKYRYLGIEKGKMKFVPDNAKGGEPRYFQSMKELADAKVNFDLKNTPTTGGKTRQQAFLDLLAKETLTTTKKPGEINDQIKILEKEKTRLENEIKDIQSSNAGRNNEYFAKNKGTLVGKNFRRDGEKWTIASETKDGGLMIKKKDANETYTVFSFKELQNKGGIQFFAEQNGGKTNLTTGEQNLTDTWRSLTDGEASYMKDRANSVATKESTIADIKKQIDAKTTEYQKAQTRQPQIQERADALSQVNKQIAEVEAQIEKATQQYQDAVKTGEKYKANETEVNDVRTAEEAEAKIPTEEAKISTSVNEVASAPIASEATPVVISEQKNLLDMVEIFDAKIRGKDGISIDGKNYKLTYEPNLTKNASRKGTWKWIVDGKIKTKVTGESTYLPENASGDVIRKNYAEVREKYSNQEIGKNATPTTEADVSTIESVIEKLGILGALSEAGIYVPWNSIESARHTDPALIEQATKDGKLLKLQQIGLFDIEIGNLEYIAKMDVNAIEDVKNNKKAELFKSEAINVSVRDIEWISKMEVAEIKNIISRTKYNVKKLREVKSNSGNGEGNAIFANEVKALYTLDWNSVKYAIERIKTEGKTLDVSTMTEYAEQRRQELFDKVTTLDELKNTIGETGGIYSGEAKRMITPYDVQYAIRNQQNNPRNITTDFLPTEYGIKAKAKEFLKQGQKLTVDRDEDFDWIPEYMQ